MASRLGSFRHLQSRLTVANGLGSFRRFGVFNEFSKQLKGEAKSNQEFQQSVKDLKEKAGVVTEDLKLRTKKTTEKLYKSVDDVLTEAEAARKKVSENVKVGFSAVREEVSANVKEKLSAAKEEVRGTFGLGKEEYSGSTSAHSGKNDGSSTTSTANNSQNPETEHTSKATGETDTLFGKIKSTLSSSPSVSLAYQKLKEAKVSDMAKKAYDVVREELNSTPAKRRFIKNESTSTASGPRSTETYMVPTKRSQLSEKWEAFKAKIKGYPAVKRLRGLSEPVQELAGDLQDRWETSDHPVVHKIQDMNETVFGENSTAMCVKEIRSRDPYFSFPDFVAEVQEMISPVLTAYFKGDVETLKEYCSPEVLERCKAEHIAYQSHGIFFDNKILHISDADVMETKMMGSSPIIIIRFQTQQIYCVRDKEGQITAGGKDTIQTVYYAWAMQQIDIDELGEGATRPIWRLREMQQINVQALI